MMTKKIKKFMVIFLFVSQGFLINTTHAGFLDSLWGSVKNSFVNSEQNIHGKMLVGDEQSSIWGGSPGGGANLKLGVSTDGVSIRDNFIKTIIRYLLGVVAMVTITVFIYTGFELFSAEGKQEVLKKSFKGFVYAAIGLAVIPLAFILVKITTGFSL